MGDLIIARHGRTALNHGATPNVGEVVRGYLDIPLDPVGVKEAIDTAERVRKAYKVRGIYTSDIPRARQTAEIVAARLNVGIIPMIGLRTWNLGDLTGKPAAEVMRTLHDLEEHPDQRAPGGGSYSEFVTRLQECLREIMHVARLSKHDHLVMTHGRVIQALPQVLSGDLTPKPYNGVNKTGIMMLLKKAGKSGWKLSEA